MTNIHSPTEHRRPLSTWELPKLAVSVHFYRQSKIPTPRIRPHFAAVLAFVHRNRIATAEQIRRRLPKLLRSDRTARRHLAEMESLGLLATQPVNNISPLMPKVYSATQKGLRHLQEALEARGQVWEPYVRDRRREIGQSFSHTFHELATTEFLLSVWEAVDRRPDLELLTVERRGLVRHPAFQVVVAARRSYLQPDGLVLFRQRDGGMMICLLEVDTGSESSQQLALKLLRYDAWMRSKPGQDFLRNLYGQHGAKQPQPVFRLLFVASGVTPDAETARLDMVRRVAADASADLQQRLWLSCGTWLRTERDGQSESWTRLSDGVDGSSPPPRRMLLPLPRAT